MFKITGLISYLEIILKLSVAENNISNNLRSGDISEFKVTIDILASQIWVIFWQLKNASSDIKRMSGDILVADLSNQQEVI